jgi:hypothetical protein
VIVIVDEVGHIPFDPPAAKSAPFPRVVPPRAHASIVVTNTKLFSAWTTSWATISL